MSMTSDVLRALAALLAAQNLGAYSEGSVLTNPTLPLITMKKMPIKIDRAIVLNMVINGDQRHGGYSDVMVQVRTRGAANDPFDADSIGDSIVPVMNHATGLTAGTSTIVSLTRQTSVQNGQDDSGRYERIDQYYGFVSWAPFADKDF